MRTPLKNSPKHPEQRWSIPHVLEVTEDQARRRNLCGWQWNPTMKPNTRMILHPSRTARSVVVVTKIHSVNNVFDVSKKQVDINTVVTMRASITWYDHFNKTVVTLDDVEVPSVLGCRLYQTPHHGPPVDEEWLKVPIGERIVSGFYGRLGSFTWDPHGLLPDSLTVTEETVDLKGRKQLAWVF